MDYSVAIATVIDDVHTHPDIYISENPLLILLILPCVVQKHTMQKLVVVDFSQR